MVERLRCAVIGAGSIGLAHLESLTQYAKADPVAIAEIHAERAREAAERYRIPRYYLDYRELLDQPDIEAVTIALPNHLHAKAAIQALQARKHVLVEKPLCLNIREALKIQEAAKKSRRIFMVSQNFRFFRGTQLAKAAIDAGEIGAIYHVRASWLRRSAIPRIGSWFTQKKFAGGGAFADLGIHILDLSLYLMNSFDVTSVSAHIQSRFGPRGMGEFSWGMSEIDSGRPFDVEDTSVALLRLKGGRSVLLEASWSGFHPLDHPEQSIHLLGEQGSISLFPARMYRPGKAGIEMVQLEKDELPLPEDRIQHFVDCAIYNRKPAVPLEQSVKLQRMVDAIYKSAATGKEVKVSNTN